MELNGFHRTDITILVRCFYLFSAAAILLVRCTPLLKDRFLDYGARSSTISHHDRTRTAASAEKSSIVALLDYLATWRVSHSYFLLFYLTSTLLSLFWLYVVYYEVDTIVQVRSHQALYALVLVCIHSIRRLYENVFISVSNTKSTMWVGHFAIGLAFYLFLHIAILVEFDGRHDTQFRIYSLQALSATLLFVLASMWQHKYHQYLASLVKYTLPTRFGAKSIVAPHYTAECLLYLSLTILAAPRDQYLNRTLLGVTIFVIVNLGVTADGTQIWQLSKFKDRRPEIEKRWRMLPGLF